MASSIYDRSRTFFSLRGHGCNGAFEPDYGVEEVSAAVKNPVLYEMQSKAPKPHAILSEKEFETEECQMYKRKYHGPISRDETARLLGSEDGNYLIRSSSSQPGAYILSFMLSNRVRHYVLMYHNNEHYVGENHYEDIEDLVADGLITLYMEEHNAFDLINKEPKLTRRPAVYSRRKSFHAHGLRMKYNNSTLRDNNGTKSLVRSGAMKSKVSTINRRRLPSESSFDSENDDTTYCDASDLRFEVARETNAVCSLTNRMDLESLQESRPDVVMSEPSILSPIVEGLQKDVVSKRNSSAVDFMYEKEHQFKVKTFGPPTWCDICNHFMWGIKSQGLRCQDCGINVHKQCAGLAEPDCIPTKNFVKRVYGIDLTTLLVMDGTKIPKVVRECVHAVESRGLHSEGIYRVSGSQDEVYAIKADFDSGLSLDLDEFTDINSITGAFKLFLRELPIPLITYKVFEQLVQLLDGKTLESNVDVMEIIPQIKECFSTLPLSHLNLLMYLLHHLRRVSSNSSVNKMSEKNLAVVFAPTVMRSPSVDVNSFKLIPKQQLLMETLIKHVDLVAL